MWSWASSFDSVFARSVSVLPLTRAPTVVFYENQVLHTLSYYHNKQLPLSIYWECIKCQIIVSALWMSLLSFGRTTANWELAAHTGRGDTETFLKTCAAADQCDWYILGYNNWVCLYTKILIFLSGEKRQRGNISISRIPLANIVCLCYGKTLLLPGEISARFLTKLFYHP